MSLNFWRRTFLEGVVPGGIGYRRVLRKMKQAQYDHTKEKAGVRHKHFGTSGWKQELAADGLKYRDYTSYEEYEEHQRSKYDEILKIAGGFSNRVTVKYRLQFYDRFRNLSAYLPPEARILCAGARQGTEVEVLRELGFANAYGIDLNPGPKNPFVKVGDFLRIDEKNSSLDLIYSNAIDHAFNLEAMFAEHARVLKPDGYIFYDVALQEGGAFEAVHWPEDEIVFRIMLSHFKHVEFVRVDKDRRWKSIFLRGVRGK